MSDWTKIKVICTSANNKPDCQGCGMNTAKDGFKWNLQQRIPCANAKNNKCSFKEVIL